MALLAELSPVALLAELSPVVCDESAGEQCATIHANALPITSGIVNSALIVIDAAATFESASSSRLNSPAISTTANRLMPGS